MAAPTGLICSLATPGAADFLACFATPRRVSSAIFYFFLTYLWNDHRFRVWSKPVLMPSSLGITDTVGMESSPAFKWTQKAPDSQGVPVYGAQREHRETKMNDDEAARDEGQVDLTPSTDCIIGSSDKPCDRKQKTFEYCRSKRYQRRRPRRACRALPEVVNVPLIFCVEDYERCRELEPCDEPTTRSVAKVRQCELEDC